jgi:hypothetical protein
MLKDVELWGEREFCKIRCGGDEAFVTRRNERWCEQNKATGFNRPARASTWMISDVGNVIL